MIYHKSVKTKIKTFFSRAILAMLMSVFCFTCTVGCSVFDGLKPTPPKQDTEIGTSDPPPTHPDHNPPTDDDADDDDDNGNPDEDDETKKEEQTGGISVDYVKVLRKPLSYDFSGNVTDKDGGETGSKEYYYSFGGDVLTYLFRTYGNFNSGGRAQKNIFDEYYQTTNNEKMNELSQNFEVEANKDNYLYWYDAIRYQITNAKPYYEKEDGSGTTENSEEAKIINGNLVVAYYEVSADFNKGWNWGLKYSTVTSEIEGYKPLMLTQKFKNDSSVITGATLDTSAKRVNNKFDLEDYNYKYFSNYYLGGIVGSNGDGYEFKPTDFSSAFIGNNTSDPVIKSDYNRALEYAIYNIVLGIQPRNMTIAYTGTDGAPVVTIDGYSATTGANAKTSAEVAVEDIKSTFNRLGAYVGLTAKNKKDIVKYILENVIGEQATAPYTVGGINKSVDYYYEDVVTAIVDYCGIYTTIGKASEEDPSDGTKIDDPYIASEVVDFPYTTFFSKFGNGDPFKNKKPYEYQSAVIVPSRETTVTDIWLDFKYDAGNDGDDIFDRDKFLDITVSIRWNKGDGSPIHVLQKNVRVFDGPIDVGGDSTIEFEFEPARGSYAFGEPVKIGKFNTPDALKTTEEQRVITISGLTNARRYYKVLESATYGGYGVLDESKFDCSYLEIAFSVAKKPGDTTTNYAFYTAISNFVEDEEEDNSWMQ